MAEGYSLIASLISLPDDNHLVHLWKELLSSLAEVENGQGLIEQLNTAMRIFSERDSFDCVCET